jgi:hypothetical protein
LLPHYIRASLTVVKNTNICKINVLRSPVLSLFFHDI